MCSSRKRHFFFVLIIGILAQVTPTQGGSVHFSGTFYAPSEADFSWPYVANVGYYYTDLNLWGRTTQQYTHRCPKLQRSRQRSVYRMGRKVRHIEVAVA